MSLALRISIALFSSIAFGTGCTSLQRELLDDDFNSNRLSWNDNELVNDLPSPKLASEEALQWMKERDDLKEAERRAEGDSLDSSIAADSEQQAWNLNIADVFVPESLDAIPYASTQGGKMNGTQRRKPLFSKGLGVTAESVEAGGLWALPGTGSTPVMAMAAKRGPRANTENLGSYIVQAGDTLGTISKKIYGSPQRWMELAHLNQLGNGSLIYPKELIFYVKDPQTLGLH